MGIIDEYDELSAIDRRRLWHPFTQMKDWEADAEPLVITEGRGCFIKDKRGRWYLDGVSSLWVNIHGHNRVEINEAVKSQLDKIAHSTMLGMANEPAIMLARRLTDLMDGSFGHGRLSRVFYSDNGSTSVEVALKMAFQYHMHIGQPNKTKFLSFDAGYHGDTLGAVSVGGVDIFHRAFGPLLFKTFKAPSPHCHGCGLSRVTAKDGCAMLCLRSVEEILNAHSDEIAAVIIEPLIQAAGGMRVAPKGFLKGLRGLCDRYDVLLIADEVATGFGRTGLMFACEHENVAPDIICLSKGLTGGYMPLAATIATEKIYSAFLGGFGELKTFFHGHSYTGNQLGCACAIAALDLFDKDETLKNLQPKIKLLEDRLDDISSLDHVGDVRNAGMMAGVELVKDKSKNIPYEWQERMGWRVCDAAKERGVFIRPLGNVVVIMPPLAIAEENLSAMMDVIKASVIEAAG